jgi:hypothetical protein
MKNNNDSKEQQLQEQQNQAMDAEFSKEIPAKKTKKNKR